MSKRIGDDLRGSFITSAGWLFADLLLVLTMLFLASSTFSFQTPPPAPRPVLPTRAVQTPTPTPTQAHLDKTPCDFTLHNLDYNGLLQNPPSASAMKDAEQKVKAQPCLQKHRGQKAGLVQAFGGAIAPDGTVNPNKGADIASRVDEFVLPMLGKQEDFIFTQDTVYNHPYHDLGSTYGTVELVIYLFA